MKRLLLVPLGLLVVLVVTSLTIGLLHPSIVVETTLHVERPPEAVWAVLVDPDRAREWTPDLARIEPLSGEPLEAGRRRRLVFRHGERETGMVETLAVADPPHRLAVELSAASFEGRREVLLVPEGSGTRLTVTTTAAGRTLLLRAFARLSRGRVKDREQEALGRLKTALEQDG